MMQIDRTVYCNFRMRYQQNVSTNFLSHFTHLLSCDGMRYLNKIKPIGHYTVNHKKGGSTFVIITLENLDGF